MSTRHRRIGARLGALAAALGPPACDRTPNAAPEAAPAGATSRGTAEEGNPEASVTAEKLRALELTRAVDSVGREALAHPDVGVRRAAARALARAGKADQMGELKHALADEDREVMLWAAFGLGERCSGNETATVKALVARAATLATRPADSGDAALEGAISNALAGCGTPLAERALVSWLTAAGPRARAAALALGRVARGRGRLEEGTLIALLDRAATPGSPEPAALFAFGELGTVPAPVSERLLEIATAALGTASPDRIFAVQALPKAGDGATPALEELVADREATVPERTAAARSLQDLGSVGQVALARALPVLLGKLAPALDGPEFPVLVAVIESLQTSSGDLRTSLERVANAPAGSRAELLARAARIRCRAASLIAHRSSLHPALAGCDPTPTGRYRELATVEVLGRGELVAARLSRWLELLDSTDASVRVAALGLLRSHREVEDTAAVLASALGDPDPGPVATAARLLASEPGLAHTEGDQVDPRVGAALGTALDADRPADQSATVRALVDAAAALERLSLKPRMEKLCEATAPVVRAAAAHALQTLGGGGCPAGSFKNANLAPVELRPTQLEFVTDSVRASITLDPAWAPATTARLLDLASSGFFDGMTIHRSVPGFVVQLGDRSGDGFGGAGREPIPSELSPVPFGPLDVGLAQAGFDTGSSQIFITLAAQPRLTGAYPWLGRADPTWAEISAGDVIRSVRVVAPSN